MEHPAYYHLFLDLLELVFIVIALSQEYVQVVRFVAMNLRHLEVEYPIFIRCSFQTSPVLASLLNLRGNLMLTKSSEATVKRAPDTGDFFAEAS